MKTIISGYTVDNFGSNNYSHGYVDPIYRVMYSVDMGD